MNKKKVFILPIDGVENAEKAHDLIFSTLSDPECMADYISHIKFNDFFHLEKAKILINMIFEIQKSSSINIFYDFKLADTNGTNVNVLKHYINLMKAGDIVTVNSNCSIRAFKEIKAIVPKGVKIAIVSVLTDTNIDECRLRRGMEPRVAILNDALNILSFGKDLFSAIVCSPSELSFLKRNLPSKLEYIVPGIRDSWMDAGQQSVDRLNGITEALDAGASYLVVGSQLTKGNPKNNISAARSRELSLQKLSSSIQNKLVKGDIIQTLKNLQGFYKANRDEEGNIISSILAYSGTYENENGEIKNYVGDTYFNLSVIESHPQILNYFAEIMVEKIRAYENENGKINCLVGVPSGGVKIAQEVGRLLNIPGICLEKKVTAIKTETAKEKIELVFRRNDHVIKGGDKVLLFEDLCNNFSTTEKAVQAVLNAGGIVVGVACVVNRSLHYSDRYNKLRIISGVNIPSGQYKQEDSEVVNLIKAGYLVTDPKASWHLLDKN